MLGLTPAEFWPLTLGQFNAMVRGYLQREEIDRNKRANEVCAMVIGFRDKRPNLKRLHNQLTGRRKTKLDDATKRILAQSNKRAREGGEGEPDA